MDKNVEIIINPLEHPRNPPLEIKLDVLHRCYEPGENIKYFMDVKRIIIKGASGYDLLGEAYEDKVTITPDSISYEYKPYPESKLKTNIYRKWKYKMISPLSKKLYCQVEEMTQHYLYNYDILFATGIGLIEIGVTSEDGHSGKNELFLP